MYILTWQCVDHVFRLWIMLNKDKGSKFTTSTEIEREDTTDKGVALESKSRVSIDLFHLRHI